MKDFILGITKDILSAIIRAHNQEFYSHTVYETQSRNLMNQFAFFIKPEALLNEYSIKYGDILRLIFEKIEKFNFSIKKIKILSAKYLDEYNIVAQHYGVINKLANNAREHISDEAKGL